MQFASTRYLRERTLFPPLIKRPPPRGLGLVVVIPAKDEDRLIDSLESLRQCDLPACHVEVIVVANTGEDDSAACVERNRRMTREAEEWADSASRAGLTFYVLHCDGLPRKHAGVGLARKIGMDEASYRLECTHNPAGVIACFDADSRCETNYLVEIAGLFSRNAACQACCIYFEHPLQGREFAREVYEAITFYELHLRYFVNAQRFTGFPFAFQAIGSSMAVRCDAYQQQNGMNKRKAGEDFYFLHKFTPLGRVAELKTTCVMPSPRISHRVPFGTGKAVADLVDSGQSYLTYAPQSFLDLRRFFSIVPSLYDSKDHAECLCQLPESVVHYLSTLPFSERIAEIRANVTEPERFCTRFFRWFNAFLVMKFLHHARDHFYPDCDVAEVARWLLTTHANYSNSKVDTASSFMDARQLLGIFRSLDRSRHGFLGMDAAKEVHQ